MQSRKLQYVMPDEGAKGQKNSGVIGQYPYFAPDTAGLKKAPKMTKADALYLKKFMAARAAADAAAVEQTFLGEKRIREEARKEYPAEDPFEDGKINITVNARLHLERNKHLKPEQLQYRGPGGQKISITDQIFGENRYVKEHADTEQDRDMQDYLKGNWESTAFVNGKPKPPAARAAAFRQKASTGNVVPFFPADWKKNANDVFNQILNGHEGSQDAYDEVTHAAIHRKIDDANAAPFLMKQLGKKTITGDRPTSGKHFARERKFSQRKRELALPNHDHMQSNVAKNFEASKKVEGLLNRLAGYMAGEIPDTEDLDNLLSGDKADKLGVDDGVTENQPFDDATTNYTKAYEEPIKRAPSQKAPVLQVEAAVE